MKKISNTEAELKKSIAYKKSVYFNFEPSFKLLWCRARDLFGLQILVTTKGFGMRISCI